MADKPSGDNKMHQIVMALITTIAAPVIVFFITNNLKESKNIEPTNVPPAITATLPADTGKPTAAAAATDVTAPQPAQPGIKNPSGSIPAGVPALVDNMALTIRAEDVTSDGQYIHLAIHIKNLGTDRRTLVFTPGSVTIQDDARHTYEPFSGDKKSGCKKGDLGISKNLVIEPNSEVTLTSASAGSAIDWCTDTSGSTLPLYTGPIAQGAKKLHVLINGIGPFQGFQVELGL